MTAKERILDLIKPSLMDCIPSFIKKYVMEKTCRTVAKDFPDLYAAFSREDGPDEEEKKEMYEIVNDIFEKQIRERRTR